MNRLFVILLTVTGLFALDVSAQDASRTQPGIVNVFACKLNPGKNMDNVWATLEALATMNVPTQNPPDPAGNIFLWTPFRSGAPYDYVWGYNNSNLNAMSRDLADYVAAPGMTAMEARFADTGTCIAMIAGSKVVRDSPIGGKADREPDAVVETFACKFKDGAGQKQLDETVALWQRDFAKIDSAALRTYAASMWTPYRGGSGESDHIWVGAYPDLKNWSQGETDYYESKEGAVIDARFDAIETCRADLWIGYWIVAPTTRG